MATAGPSTVRPGYVLPRRQTLVACGGLTLGMFMAAVNQTIITTALPQIVDDLGGIASYSWAISAFMLALTVTVPVWGRLSDVHGRRPYFMAAIVVFAVGSVIGATAQSMEQLIVARVVQGIGGGGLIPLAIATVGDLVPAHERGRWQGLHGGVVGVAAIVGPLIGGGIVDHADWRWVFLVSLPLALAAFITAAIVLRVPRLPSAGRRIDALGGVLLTAALLALLVGVLEWGEARSLGPRALVPLATGAVLLFALARHERRVDDPFIPVELLSDAVFRRGSVVAFAMGAGLFGATTYLPLFAQGALGETASTSGLMLMPLLLTMVVVSVASGTAIAHTGRYRWAIAGGAPLMAAGFAGLAAVGAGTSPAVVVAPTVLVGAGLGLLTQNIILVLQNAMPARHLGAATAGAQLARTSGGTVWVAVLGAITVAGLGGGGALDAVAADAAQGARDLLASALRPVFLATVALMLLAAWMGLRIPDRPLRTTVADEPAEASAHQTIV